MTGVSRRTAAPATVVGLILSDVVGNSLDVIASGPTAPDSTTFSDVQAAVDNYILADGATAVSAACKAAVDSEYTACRLRRAVIES